jgi:hypothetical protein
MFTSLPLRPRRAPCQPPRVAPVAAGFQMLRLPGHRIREVSRAAPSRSCPSAATKRQSPQSSRRELTVEPAITVAVVTAAISAAGTVLAAWVQARAPRRPRRDGGRARSVGRGSRAQDTDHSGGRPGALPR